METTIPPEKINLFRSLFRGRTDVYARFWTNFTTKKSGYTPVYRLNKQSVPLNDLAIGSHLMGKELIGIYPLLKDNTTYFLAIDFDKEKWFEEAGQLLKEAQNHNLPCYLERSKSGQGGHVWFFFETNIPAWKARQLGKLLLEKSQLTPRRAFDRMFPSQDEHTGKGLGNLIALPLQGSYLKQGNTAFIDEQGEMYSDQWAFLSSIIKITENEITKIIKDFKLSSTSQKPSKIKRPTLRRSKTTDRITDDEDDEIPITTTSRPEAKLILSNQIYIPETWLPDKLFKFLKRKLNFANPQFHELERRGYSTWKTPRWIKNIETLENGILTPIGFLTEIQRFATENDLKLELVDKRVLNKPTSFKTKLKLRPEQQKVARGLLKQDRVILEAKPGFGKTMVALHCVKRRRQPTLIIVHTRALLHQWKKRIEERFELKEGDLGIIGENKWQVGKKITIASYQTLVRRGVEEIRDKFGFVVVDECHHVPARTFTEVVKSFPAKHVQGLTATAYRKDKLDRLMTFYLGPIIKAKAENNAVNAKPGQTTETVDTKLFVRRTGFETDGDVSTTDFHELGRSLITNHERNQMITNDIVKILQTNGKCLVLTERVEHCQILLGMIRKNIKGVHAAAVSGRITKKRREALIRRVREDRFQLLIATGRLIGEGFDWPELTHLFLAFPFSWKGKLVQYVGRVQRATDGKEMAYVYDYVDYQIPMLRIMYFKRLRTYRNLSLVREKNGTRRNKRVAENQLSLFEG